MKSFKEYLTESKKTYDFKIRIAGTCPKDSTASIKSALSEFDVAGCSSGKSTPIQETQLEFPEIKNCSVTIFDVSTNYPTTSVVVQSKIAEALKIANSNIKVRTVKEEEEFKLNHENDTKSGKALLGTDYESSNHQNIVGDKHAMSLLKTLGKTKHQGTQFKGINDQLLADKEPAEKTAKVKTIDKAGAVSTIGSKKMNNPDPSKGRK